jgi:hypothetical protein
VKEVQVEEKDDEKNGGGEERGNEKADRKEEKKEPAEAEPAEAEAESEEEEDDDDDVCDDEDDGTDDDTADVFVRRDAAVPDGWVLVAECPSIDKRLVGRHFIFRFNVTGWTQGRFTKFYNKPKGGSDNNFNVEMRCDGLRRDACLRPHLYATDNPAWFMITCTSTKKT